MLFGTTAGFAEIVTYYKNQLKEGGDLVFREPPTHTFDVGRFREETMVFPPGVTVKDFTFGGSQGYPNPRLNGQPAAFRRLSCLFRSRPQPLRRHASRSGSGPQARGSGPRQKSLKRQNRSTVPARGGSPP